MTGRNHCACALKVASRRREDAPYHSHSKAAGRVPQKEQKERNKRKRKARERETRHTKNERGIARQ
jgi:hypothetical protein